MNKKYIAVAWFSFLAMLFMSYLYFFWNEAFWIFLIVVPLSFTVTKISLWVIEPEKHDRVD